jgi:hypothetical protein
VHAVRLLLDNVAIKVKWIGLVLYRVKRCYLQCLESHKGWDVDSHYGNQVLYSPIYSCVMLMQTCIEHWNQWTLICHLLTSLNMANSAVGALAENPLWQEVQVKHRQWSISETERPLLTLSARNKQQISTFRTYIIKRTFAIFHTYSNKLC